MPPRVVAIIAAYNEERFIGGCLEHLFANGVEAYLCDNESTDRTVEIATGYLGRGLRGIETLPRDGTYRWRQILARKEQLARELDADWFLHLDPDEIPQSSRPDQTLAEALAEADAAGYNAVEFHELTFVATREQPDHDHPQFRQTMRWYYPFAPAPLHRVIAWKRQARVNLVRTGGHQARFRGRRISPQPLFLRHYLILSREHMLRKYVQRLYDAGEVREGWHGWRASLTPDGIDLPSQAQLRFTADDADLDSSSARRRHFIEWPQLRPRTGLGADDARPVVLCIVNRPGWAHDLKTRALTAALAGEYRLVTRYQSEVTEADILSADLVLVYYWLQLDELVHLRPAFERVRNRLMIGVCSEYELEGAWRRPGLAMLSWLPCAVFANNLKLAQELEATLGRTVCYTPNGVDTEFFEPAVSPPPHAPLRVGWAGSLTNHTSIHRGVRELIGPAVAAVEGAELCLAAREDRWRDAQEMREFYQSLHVYVCASRSEGTPNPCLEAAACGLPVVTTAVGNMPELIRDSENGLFITRDVDDIAARLRRLRDDPELRERMGRAARAAVESWDWRRQARRFAEMFEAVLDGRLTVPPPPGAARRATDAVIGSRIWRAGSRAARRLVSFWRRASTLRPMFTWRREKAPARWTEITGWFQWRSGQEEAVRHFEDGSRFVEVGNYLGRSLCSLGELVQQSGKRFVVVGIDTCRGSGLEGPRQKDYHGAAVREGRGTFAGTLHRNVISCGLAEVVSLIVSDSLTAASFFEDRSIAWVHLDARHDREHLIADIHAWLPKVQRGGWLSGDDYDEIKWPDVIATINETLPDAKPWSVNQWRLLIE